MSTLSAVGVSSTSEIYENRDGVAEALCGGAGADSPAHLYDALVDTVRRECKCYAGLLGTARAGHKGYADRFEQPKRYAGRVADAAAWGPPKETEVSAKPWLQGLRRLIFISDMGDALSHDIAFEFLRDEIIANVHSAAGSRHVWLWLTKRPACMANFGEWLAKQRIPWPDNLMAMTTVTSQQFAARVDQLRRVPAKLRGLSLEPLFGPVRLDLAGIDWLITGGGSDVLAAPFQVEWALQLREQCHDQGVAFFLKQLGKYPCFKEQPLHLGNRHGGDWDEWPTEWRTREIPAAFQDFETRKHNIITKGQIYEHSSTHHFSHSELGPG